MPEGDNAVVAPVETATEELKTVPVAPTEQELADLQAKYEVLEAEKAKIEAEKENYRKGMLKAKGRVVEDELPDEDEETRITRIVDERLLASREVQNVREREELVQTLLAKNKELAHALKNKPLAGSGSGNGEPPQGDGVKTDFFDKETLAMIKAKGLDPEKVKANYLKKRES